MDESMNKQVPQAESQSDPEILVSRPASAAQPKAAPKATETGKTPARSAVSAPRRAVRNVPSAPKTPSAPAAPSRTVSASKSAASSLSSASDKAPRTPKPSAPARTSAPLPSATAKGGTEGPSVSLKTPIGPLPKSVEGANVEQTLFIQNLFAGKKDEKAEKATQKDKKAEKVPAESAAESAEAVPVKETVDGGGILISVLKAVVYIAFVLVVSGFLAIYGIRVANDIFAFVKDDMTVEVTITEGMNLEDVSELLYEKGLIENADWFRIYMEFKEKGEVDAFVPGTYTLNSTMNYNTLFSSLTPRAGRAVISVTIPEGFTVDQIIDLLVEKGIGTREGYVDAIQNYDYNYKFMDVLKSIELKDGRKYRLEGYLYPNTYEFYQDSGEIAVVDKMLNEFEKQFLAEYSDRLTELGRNMDEILVLASMIEREALKPEDMGYISAVFHNRLNNSASFPYLQSDATVQYALGKHKEDLTQADLEIDDPYNTHVYKGLPPGAICNPGFDAIFAALYPEDKLMQERGVKSYYFVAGVDGYSIFAADLPEHNRNVAKVKADRESLAAAQG